MGSVYLADDLELGECVAVKMLLPARAGAEFIERLRSEVRLARRVTHRNVARTYDIGEHEGGRFLTMEYVDGESLGARIARDGALTPSSFFRLAKDIAAGLAAAHAAGVVHRDLKPANILVADDGRAVITDFGLAWSSDARPEDTIAGTPSYMAPEQFLGQFDQRSDIFALGVLFHVMLTATKPFTEALHERPLRPPNPCDFRPGLPVALGALVARCLAPVAADRFAGVSEVLDILASTVAEVVGDEPAPKTVATGVLRAVSPPPRSILVRVVGSARDTPMALGLRDELANRINEHPSLCAFGDAEREHEASAHIEVREGERALELDVRLLASRDGFEFWRASFKGSPADAIDLAQAAVRGIERALAVDVPEGSKMVPLGEQAARSYFAGRAAYDAFLPERLQLAAASFEAALVHAPAHPLLLSALASTRARQSFYSEGHMDQAREAADLAVSLAPNLAEAHVARAAIHSQNNEIEHEVASLLRAVELAPGHIEALSALGRRLLEVGAPADAIRLSEAVYSRDRSDLTLPTIARAHALLGHYDRASETYDRMRGEARDNFGLALKLRMSVWRRDRATVMAAIGRIHALGRAEDLSYRLMLMLGEAVLEGRSPRTSERLRGQALAGAASRARRALVHQLSAEAEAYLGDFENAMSSIESALEGGLFDVFWVDRCPVLDELRGSARFEAAREVAHGRARRALALFHARPL
jgi:serine/threonine-protein kinase